MGIKDRMEEMCVLLEELKGVQETLLRLSREKKAAVIKNDTKRLSEIVEAEYRKLSEMKKIERRRVLLTADAVGENGRPSGEITAWELAAKAEGETRLRLERVLSELGGIVSALRNQNEQNRELIKTQLEYTETMLNFIGAGSDPLNNFYGTDGRSSSAGIGNPALFDTEI